jgi:P4 family phage/plasmid primase-like protien
MSIAVNDSYVPCPICRMPDSVWLYEEHGMPVMDVLCDCDKAQIREDLKSADSVALAAADEPLWRDGSLAETDIAARLGAEFLSGRYIAWGKNRWRRWDGKVWKMAEDAEVYGATRKAIGELVAQETAAANKVLEEAMKHAAGLADDEAAKTVRTEATKAHSDKLKRLQGLFWVNRLKTLMQGAREILHVDQREFDAHRDLLNVNNGVINLETGELMPHDPGLKFTKISGTNYVPGATHPDWDTALTALPDEVADWMKVRFGQAATGYAASDDIVPFMHGGGGNGKSTILDGVIGALGKGADEGYAVMIPDKVLLGNQNDHPTEVMTLKGARFGYIEELPEGDYLNAVRLKKAAGTDGMTARYIGQDSVEWTATHSLFVTTNYKVRVDAVDDGTWRRVAEVKFPYSFRGDDPQRPKDHTLRDRIRDGKAGQHEAALAWLVNGAMAWYAAGRIMPTMPDSVRADTDVWRHGSNKAIEFLGEFYEPAPGWAVPSADVFTDFSEWAANNGNRRWAADTFWTRAEQHDWFKSGQAQRSPNPVRTGAWEMGGGAKPARARLVTGIRRLDDSSNRDALPLGSDDSGQGA